MYVLVRADLPPGSQLTQAVHAATDYSLKHPERTQATPTVVVLHVADEDELLDWADFHTPPRGEGVLFHEPDINEHTALCTVNDGAPFSSLRLAGAAMLT